MPLNVKHIAHMTHTTDELPLCVCLELSTKGMPKSYAVFVMQSNIISTVLFLLLHVGTVIVTKQCAFAVYTWQRLTISHTKHKVVPV